MASPILFEKLARPGGEFLAYLRTSPVLKTESTPEVVFLGGFKSDMSGSKAAFLRQLGTQSNFAVTTFDYFGHGLSSGQFTEGTISRWLDDTLAVIDHVTSDTQMDEIINIARPNSDESPLSPTWRNNYVTSDTHSPMPEIIPLEHNTRPHLPAPSVTGSGSPLPGLNSGPSNSQASVAVAGSPGHNDLAHPHASSITKGPASPSPIMDHVASAPRWPVILVGSSMGGWLMTLAALKRPHQVKALIGLAAAPDFTEDLIWSNLPPPMRAKLMTEGTIYTPSKYDKEGYPITRKLLEDGRHNLVLRESIPLDLPIHLIHGTADRDVPWEQSRRLMDMVRSSRVSLTLVKGGDHRLSTPEDLSRLAKVIEGMLELVS